MEHVYQAPDIRLISGETKQETDEWSLVLSLFSQTEWVSEQVISVPQTSD